MASVAVCMLFVMAGTVNSCRQLQASDWNRFRGPNGTGICSDPEPLPVEFSESKHLQWKTALPGSGVSSPIVVGEKIFVTCYSGYGVTRDNVGQEKDLKRHVVCVDRNSGSIVWEKTIAAFLPEDEYTGMGVPEHGYASHTPVSDGENVFVFLGKSGVRAFDLNGKELWQTSVGVDSDDRGWGSSSSLMLYKDTLIVPAGPECRAIVGLDRLTGKELWKAEGDSLGNVWGTPVLSQVDDSRSDIVIGTPYEIWGINPTNGKLRWYCEAMDTDQFNSSVVVHENVVYAVEGRGGGSIAVRTGGKGNVTASHIAWSGQDSNRFSTPLIDHDRMYLISGGRAKCVNTKDDSKVYETRLKTSAGGPKASTSADEPGRPDGESGGRRRGPGGGRGGDYSSPVIGDGRIYYVSRSGDVHVLKLGDDFEELATNRITADTEDFSATPAISSGQLLIRSSRHLYCVSQR